MTRPLAWDEPCPNTRCVATGPHIGCGSSSPIPLLTVKKYATTVSVSAELLRDSADLAKAMDELIRRDLRTGGAT